MADIKLTDATWLEYNKERVRGRLMVILGQSETYGGLPESELAQILEGAGLVYTAPQLQAIRTALLADETIEMI